MLGIAVNCSTIREDFPKVPESALAAVWARADTLPDGLVTEDGQNYRVLYPGRPNSRAGPDFLDAVFITDDGTRIAGDVELHIDSQGWYGHRHHIDPNYNGVVLHVVLHTKPNAVTRGRSGITVPIVSLSAEMVHDEKPKRHDLKPFASQNRELSRKDIEKLLDRAGDERLLAKAEGFSLEMAFCDPEQVLYRGIMEALGYSSNRKPFRLLADHVPLSLVYGLRSEPKSSRLVAINLLLMSASGLTNEASDHEARLIRRVKRHLPRVKPIAPDSWKTFRVRPSNHPIRRIEGAASLLDSFIDTGLLRGLESRLLSGSNSSLERALIVPKRVGRQRARDIVVNVLFPFFVAYSGLSGNTGLRETCLKMYQACPKPSDNEVTREMTRIIGISDGDSDIAKVVNSARRHQGLMHLYRRGWHVGKPVSVD